MREAIGNSLRTARTGRRRTLREVSRRARVSLGYLSEVERGRKEASSELLAAICEALDIALAELLTDAAGALVAAAPAVGAHLVRPAGLRHADLRLAGEAPPLSGPVPVVPVPIVPVPGNRPQPVARVAA